VGRFLESGGNDLRELPPVPHQSLSVYEEGGRAVSTGSLGAGEVRLDARAVGAPAQRGLRLVALEPERARNPEQVLGSEPLAARQEE